MSRAVGADGAHGGWAVAEVEGSPDAARVLRWHLLPAASQVLALPGDAVGVDMPVGLPERGRRACDLQAKAVLGRAHPRVFLTPPRGVLRAASYDEAGARHRELTGGLGLSVQTWHLVPRIREVDEVADDPRLVETHPELSFAALGGAGPLPSKKTAQGRAARIDLLERVFGPLTGVPPRDDGLDALACAWSALRWVAGVATVLPRGEPPLDARNRPMRIVT